MTDPANPDPARSFGGVADSYDRGRPSYPVDAVKWLVGEEPCSVLELGAGTGKLTEVLVGLGHDVFATDPDDAMLDILSGKLPDVRATSGTAEQIPIGDSLYDVVVVGQAFHWFDHAKALAEIGRVLRTDGRLAVVQNERDERIPWVRKLGRLIGKQTGLTEEGGFDPTSILDDSGFFSAVEAQTFRHWQVVDRHSIQDLVQSRSNIATLEPEAQEQKRREVLAFYDDYGRGMDGMQLPYNCRAWRAQVLPHAQVKHTVEVVEMEEPEPKVPLAKRTDTAVRLPRVITDPENGDDDLLIDFR
ncbi:class I SAM-dependent methyltransferase [Nocardioides sp. NBC_00850]|uniref:class I SAM-dependent methyltransferase n=1 Tax=Nocardioides sp. NBC_00850 TaxID=2976001 RepID=UPI0038667ED8|nr:class I SAM-dependent methyltransferase [Nocardioides sp. NBC_00850]